MYKEGKEKETLLSHFCTPDQSLHKVSVIVGLSVSEGYKSGRNPSQFHHVCITSSVVSTALLNKSFASKVFIIYSILYFISF